MQHNKFQNYQNTNDSTEIFNDKYMNHLFEDLKFETKQVKQ